MVLCLGEVLVGWMFTKSLLALENIFSCDTCTPWYLVFVSIDSMWPFNEYSYIIRVFFMWTRKILHLSD